MSDTSLPRPARRSGRLPESAPAGAGAVPIERRKTPRSGPAPDDRFFRYLVTSMRNAVIAVRRDGTIALMNDEAYRIFGLDKSPDGDVGRAFSEVLRELPPVIR